jgi:hypothetical protein
VISHPAISIDAEGNVAIDVEALKQFAESDSEELDAVLARMILISYEAGFHAGVQQVTENDLRTQMLLLHTGGNA